jgi:UDP-galactopyranose mutase
VKPRGVVERFAVDVLPHPLLAQLRGPVLGYAGAIDARINLGLIAALADAFPDGHVALVGPVRALDPIALPRRTNVHLTGAVPYDSLPSWLAGFDVALVPFVQDVAEVSSSPQVIEYAAAGKPVVSTATVAGGAEAFIAEVRKALQIRAERMMGAVEDI